MKAAVITAAGLEAFRAVAGDVPDLETEVVVNVEPSGDETSFEAAIDGASTAVATMETDPEEPACIVYTSGTTGEPKGVVLPHRTLLGVLPSAVCGLYDMAVRGDDIGRTPVEWSWVASLFDAVLPGLYFGNSFVAADLGPFDPARELRLLERHEVTLTGGPPTAFRVVLNHPAVEETDLSALRVIVFGGEAAGDALVERARQLLPEAAVHEVYGQTEAPFMSTDCEALGMSHRSGKMGKPAPGTEVRVVDEETLEPFGTGESGEFALRRQGNPMCFTEYWNAPEKTAEKVRNGWQRCEDLGSMDENGYLEFHSRKDDIIVSSGHKVSPVAVEDTLVRHPTVVNVGVIGVPDETRGELVKAFVKLESSQEPTEDLAAELQGFVKDHLAKHEYPRAIEFVDELPKTTTGKVRRRSLRELEGLVEPA